MATLKKAATPQAGCSFTLGDIDSYSSGGGLPEGDYIWKDVSIAMFQAKKQNGDNAGPPRLGVIITMTDMSGVEERTQFWSMGSKADQSWAPNESGKGLVDIPGGPGGSPNKSTNWAMLLQSLYDSGMPKGILQNDTSVLDGLHCHMANVPEPEERKGFQARTGEGMEQTGPRTIAVVTEIKDDGKPWEGTGGVPAAAPAKAAPKPTGVQPAKTQAVKPVSTPSPATNGGLDEADIALMAQSAANDVLSKFPKGLFKLQLKTGMFKYVQENADPATANLVVNHYFTSDAMLGSLVEQLGYTVKGNNVSPN